MAQDQTVIEKRQRDSYPQSCTPDQWAVMLDFLCVHTGLGRPTNEMRSETRQRLWSELTSLLNALGPIARSREEWRQYWQQRVATARQRAAELSNAVSSEKRASPVGLSEDDARVLSVVGDEVALEVVEGHVVQKRRERQSPSGSLYPRQEHWGTFSLRMGDKNPSQQWGPGRPHPCASDVSDRFGPSVVDIDTSYGYSTEYMASDSDFTVVSSRRLNRKIRRTSPTGRQPPKKASGMRSYTISYVPTTTTDILNSLIRQSLTEYFELVAPGQVEEIRINAQKNILSVEVNTKTILDTLKAIAYQAVPQASTAATEATTSRKQRTHDYLARLTEAQERLTQLREQQAAEDTNFRTQVLRRFEEAQATTTRQIAIAEHQARVMDELAATMQNILRLLARDSQQPPPKHSKQ
ncbi:hypothetical protein HPB49_005690 [Dermacentor silvarum]|uniref:Uncharacterized protein n=1 Tax=Dermacentor silvarum TaxID=543639 RepID=A0ACB8D326_DERSI|nr:hypothetical protein HPB49_005690 [Dermacentor silvarum]